VKGLSRSEAEALYPPDQPQAYESASLVGIGDGLFLVFEFWLFFFATLVCIFLYGGFILHFEFAYWTRALETKDSFVHLFAFFSQNVCKLFAFFLQIQSAPWEGIKNLEKCRKN
jgi:hypothetical protein